MKRLAAFIMISLFCLTACGVKGNLQPKGKPEPRPATNLQVRQQGQTVLLSWSIPTGNQDGSALTDLAGFRIGFYSYQPEKFCPECKDQGVVATILTDNPYPATILNQTVYFRDSAVSENRGVRYRIEPFTGSGKVAPTTDIRLTIKSPPAAPVNLKAEQLDRGINLIWNLPENIQESGELLGVNIYRGENGKGIDPEPINQKPLKGNNLDDFGLKNGTTYQYGLRSVIRAANSVVESEMSEIIKATPQAGL